MKKIDLSLWNKRLDEEYNEREKKRVEALSRAIELLKAYFKDKPVEKVVLVGSILEEGRFFPFSDIDVVVDGLKEEYFKTLTELEEMLERNIDLIELGKCRFKDSLEKGGLRII